MTSYKKKQIKSQLKAKWYWLLATGLFLIAGIVFLFVGLSMTGWNFVEWIKSPTGITFIIVVVIALFFGLILWANIYKAGLGGKAK